MNTRSVAHLRFRERVEQLYAIAVDHGAPERIRTSGPQIRNLMLYPAELRAHHAVALGMRGLWGKQWRFGCQSIPRRRSAAVAAAGSHAVFRHGL